MSAPLDAFLAFAFLAVVFVPLEAAFALRRQRVLRPEWGTDLAFFLGQQLAWSAPVAAALVFVHGELDRLPLADLRAGVAELPFALQFLSMVLLCDLATYWFHRASHRFGLLWRFHRVHHTSERMDWLAAFREHPLDNLVMRLVENLPAFLLGFPLASIAGFAAFRGLWALYIHSNVTLSPGPLRFVLGAPRLHHWHHEPELGGAVNLANVSPLMDVLFGTWHDPGHGPARCGVREPVRRGFLVQLLDPLLPAAATHHRDPPVSLGAGGGSGR